MYDGLYFSIFVNETKVNIGSINDKRFALMDNLNGGNLHRIIWNSSRSLFSTILNCFIHFTVEVTLREYLIYEIDSRFDKGSCLWRLWSAPPSFESQVIFRFPLAAHCLSLLVNITFIKLYHKQQKK